jgi:filamentous hemagglutinin family protein
MKARKSIRPLLMAAALLSVGILGAAPQDPVVRVGTASISAGTATVINQSTSSLVIDWQSFDLAAGESVRFNQPSSSSVALNRVISGNPSSIFGRIDANGRVILVNSAGILFGAGSQVNTGAFVASSLELDESTLGSDRLRFFGASGSVENAGSLNGQEFVAIVAPTIVNSGSVRGSSVALAAGSEVIISTAGGLFDVQVPTAAVKAAIENKGGIIASQGNAYLTARGVTAAAASLSNPGKVEATGLVERDGRIYLESDGALTSVGEIKATRAADGGDIEIKGGFVALGGTVSADGAKGGTIKVGSVGMLSLAENVTAKGLVTSGGSITYRSAGQTIENSTGRSDVSGRIDGGRLSLYAEQGVMSSGSYLAVGATGKGGMIDLTGYGVRLLSATLDASGRTQGGLIRVGGAFQGGKNLGIRGDNGDLLQSYVGRWDSVSAISNSQRTLVNDSSILKVLATAGEGGTAIVWSDVQTTMAGKILAGGVRGGVVEISSAGELRKASIDLISGARHILLDPKNILIGTAEQLGSWGYSAIIGSGYTGSKDIDLNTSTDTVDTSAYSFASAKYGSAVAINGDGTLLAVGSPGSSEPQYSSVRLYSFSGSVPFQGAQLQATIGFGFSGGKNIDVTGSYASNPSNVAALKSFGGSVSLNSAGDLLAVGDVDDNGGGTGSFPRGSVRLFAFGDSQFSGGALQAVIGSYYSGGKNFNMSSYLFDSGNDYFGRGVSLNAAGDRLAVGAPYADASLNNDGQSRFGAVFLYSFSDFRFSGAQLRAKIRAGISGATFVSSFGNSVALNAAGDRLAVGEVGDGQYATTNRGRVRLISFSDNTFSSPTYQATIGNGYTGGKSLNLGSAVEDGDWFGSSVAFNAAGNLLAIGATEYGVWGGTDPVNQSGGYVRLISFTDNNFSGAALVGTIGNGYAGSRDVNLASAIRTGDQFGASVSLSAAGNRLAVGAPGDDGSYRQSSGAGAVRLFTFTDSAFSGGKLVATMGSGYLKKQSLDLGSWSLQSDDGFGQAIAFNADGTRMAIGSPYDDGSANIYTGMGAVRLFSFADTKFAGVKLESIIGGGYVSGAGTKNLNLQSIAPGIKDFGKSVALNAAGDRLAVGASEEVRLFKFTDSSFSNPSLVASIGAGLTGANAIDTNASIVSWSGLGTSVALNASGDMLVAGTPGTARVWWSGVSYSPQGNGGAGSVQMITFADSSFSAPLHKGTIGYAYLSLGGKTDLQVEIGQYLDAYSGWAYGEAFGSSVSLNASGTVLVVGALGTPTTLGSNGPGYNGSVRWFSFSGVNFSGPSLTAKWVGTDVGDMFGARVKLDATGARLVVSVPGDDGPSNANADSGALYFYDGTNGVYHGNAYSASSLYGSGITGVTSFDVNSGWTGLGLLSGGKVSLIPLASGSPTAVRTEIGLGLAQALSPSDFLGFSVALNAIGDRLAVGALGDSGFANDSASVGAVRLFAFSDAAFSGGHLVATIGRGYVGGNNLDITSTLGTAHYFGSSVSLNAVGDRLAVGAYSDNGYLGIASLSGAVRLFTFSDGSFSGGQLASTIGRGYVGGKNLDLGASLESGDYFGGSVSLNAVGDRLAVGSWTDDGFGNAAANSGAVRLFTFSDNSFTGAALASTLGYGYIGGKNVDLSSTLEAGDYLGMGVALNAAGTRLAIGAPVDGGEGNVSVRSGAVYLISFTDGAFSGGSVVSRIGSGYAGGKNLNLSGTIYSNFSFGSSVSFNASGTLLAAGSIGDSGFSRGYSHSGSIRTFGFSDENFSAPKALSVIGRGYVGALDVDLGSSLLANDRLGRSVSLNASGLLMAAGADGSGDSLGAGYGPGSVRLFGQIASPIPASLTFSNSLADDYNIKALALAAALASGASVTLQASNDIFVTSLVDAGVGSAGELLLYAGRNVRFDADVRIGSRDLGVVANASAADGVIGAHRDAGQGGFTMAPGVSVVAGDFAVLVRGVDASSSNPNSSPGSVTLGSVTATRFGVGISGSGLSGRTITQNVGSSIAVSGDVTLANQLGDISLAESGNGAWSGTISLSASGSLAVRAASALTIDSLSAASFDVRSSGVVTVTGPVSLGASGYGFMSSTSATFSDDITLVAAADMRVNASGSITLAGITPSLAAGSQLRFYGCDDVVVSAPIAAASGSVGELRLTAGRDIKLNANVSLGGADLYARANAKVSDGIYGSYRPVGQGDFTMGSGTLLNADSVTVIVRGVDTDVTNVNTSPGGITLAGVTAGSLTLAVEGTGFTDRVISQFVGSNVSVSGVASVSNSLGNVYLSSTGNGAWAGTTNLSAYGTLSLNVASALSLGGLSAGSFTVISAGAMNVGGATSLGMSGTGLLRAPGINVAGSVSVGMFSTLNVVSSSEMRLTGASASISTGGSLRLWSTNLAIDTTNRMGYNYKLYGATYGVSNVTSTGIGWIYSLSSPYALSAPAAMSSSAGMSLQMANYFRPVTPAFLGAYPMVSPAAPRSFESFFNSGELILPILSAPYQWDGVHDEEASSWLLDTKRDSASTTPAPKR